MQCVNPELGKLVFDLDILEDTYLREKVNQHLSQCELCKTQWADYQVLMKDLYEEEELHPEEEKLIETVSKYSVQKLPQNQKNQVQKHLLYCKKCQERAVYLKQTDEIIALAENGEEGLLLPPNWTPEREQRFTERVMSSVEKDYHKNLPENHLVAQKEPGYIKISQFFLKPGFAFPRLVGISLIILFGIIGLVDLLQSTKKDIVVTNSSIKTNNPSDFPVNNNSATQKSNNSQEIKPTPIEERAVTNQEKKTPMVAENRKNTADEQQNNLGNKQPVEQTQVQEIAALSEPQRSSNQRILIQIEHPFLKIPIHLSQWSESHFFTATLLEEIKKEDVWSSKLIKPINQKDTKVVRFTVPTNLLSSGNYTLRIKGYKKNAAEVEESFTYYFSITRKSDK